MIEEKYPDTIKELWENRVKNSSNKVFLVENGKHYTYSEINTLVDQKVIKLKQLKIQSGDIVALQFELDLENIVTILACLKLNVVINPLNPHCDSDEVKD